MSLHQPLANEIPFLSKQATIGRNSNFTNLTAQDREELGGIEYRSLKLLLKIVLCELILALSRHLLMPVAYFFGLQLFGAICLVGWIQHADSKYIRTLEENAINKNWW